MNDRLSSNQRLAQATLSVEEIRRVDSLAIRSFGMHPLVLMENAALGCARWLSQRFPKPAEAWILCGKGNNGGDGFAIARHLSLAGWRVNVLTTGQPNEWSVDARANYAILKAEAGDPCVVFCDFDEAIAPSSPQDIILDCMVGTGASGPPRPPFDAWIEKANASAGYRVAIDIPTGIDGETGVVSGTAFAAAATLTFVAKKPAMRLAEAGNLFGEIEVLPIGIPTQLVEFVLRTDG